jgi:hypothetical protein
LSSVDIPQPYDSINTATGKEVTIGTGTECDCGDRIIVLLQCFKAFPGVRIPQFNGFIMTTTGKDITITVEGD